MRIRYLFPLVALLLLASACGSDEPQPTAVPATATAPIVSQATPMTAPASGQQPTAIPAQKQLASTPATDSGQGQTAIPKLDLDATPANLKSYRVRFTLSFEGKRPDGEALKGSAEFIQEAITETKEQRIRFASTRQDEKKDEDKAAVDRFILGDVNYYYITEGDDKGQCISLSSGAPTTPQLAIFTPSDFVGNPQNPRLVEKGVTINGIKTNRYAIEESNLKGEAWIAQEGNFVVKYTGELTGKVALFDGADGVAKWEYQLEADAVSKFELPEACVAQKLVDNIPLPASAVDKYQLGDVVSFRSSESPQRVADFYKVEMTKLGWAQGEASEAGDLFLLEFKKDARTVSITINKEGAGSGVVITEKKD